MGGSFRRTLPAQRPNAIRRSRPSCAFPLTTAKNAGDIPVPGSCPLMSKVNRVCRWRLRCAPAPELGENFPTHCTRGADAMKSFLRQTFSVFQAGRRYLSLIFGLLLAAPAFAQTNSPWENAVNVLQQAFTSTIARGLCLVAIVVSGLTFAFGEGGSKRVLAGVLFGVGMAIAAVNFLAWLFPA